MKKVVLLALLFTGCHLAQPITQAQVLTIISDARYGVAVGCDSGWLEPPVCNQVNRILDDAQVGVQASSGGWAPVAKAVILKEEERLAPDSKLRPYLDAVVSLL